MSLIGLDKLVKRLRSLPRRVAGPIAAKVVTAGLVVFFQAAKAASPPYIAKSIGYRLVRKRDPRTMRGLIGVNVAHSSDKRVKWAPIQVMGSKQRFRPTKNGQANTGKIQSNPCVNSAIQASRGEAAAAMTATLKTELAKINKG